MKSLQDDIDAWDTRLADYHAASLTTQFTAMETALATLKKSQTSALSGLSTSMLGNSSSS